MPDDTVGDEPDAEAKQGDGEKPRADSAEEKEVRVLQQRVDGAGNEQGNTPDEPLHGKSSLLFLAINHLFYKNITSPWYRQCRICER